MKLKYIITNAILSLSLTTILMAQDKTDPYVRGDKGKVKQIQAGKAATSNPTHNVVFEVFSLALKDASVLVRDDKGNQQTYDYLVKKGKQETMVLMSGRSGERSTNVSAHELIYPTAYEPGKVPNSIEFKIVSQPKVDDNGNDVPDIEKINKSLIIKELSKLKTSPTGTAFESRNLGLTIELEFVLGKNNDADLSIKPEFVEYIGDNLIGEGVSKTPMPNFETQRLNTSVSMTLGKPHIIGTINRPPSSKLDGDEKRVWFATVVIKPVKR